MRKPKLELTWIGKENRPRREPRLSLSSSEPKQIELLPGSALSPAHSPRRIKVYSRQGDRYSAGCRGSD